jgi:hypothetical protein
MSVNRERSNKCACCGQRWAQRYSLFCEECWRNDAEGVRKVMNMPEYNVKNPVPRVRVPRD